MIPAAWGIEMALERDYDRTSLLPTVDVLDAMERLHAADSPQWRERLGALSNVAYVARWRPFAEAMQRAGGDVRQAEPVRFDPLPQGDRYGFADRLVRGQSVADFVRALRDSDWARRSAVVPFEPFAVGAGRVLEAMETANTARLVVDCPSRAFLVASVTRHKYWRATLDGQPIPIVAANLAYQGVVVPAGRHEIAFTYHNPLFVPFGTLSGLTTLALVIVAARSSARRFTSGDAAGCRGRRRASRRRADRAGTAE